MVLQNWDGSAWLNEEKGISTYDGNNNLTESLAQNWDDSVWVNSSKLSYNYDSNNNLIQFLSQFWYGFWVNSDRS